MIDEAIELRKQSIKSTRDHRILTSGNRIIAGLVFNEMNVNRFNDPNFAFKEYITAGRIEKAVDNIIFTVLPHMNSFHPRVMIASFFKNQTKSRALFEFVARQNSKSQVFTHPQSKK